MKIEKWLVIHSISIFLLGIIFFVNTYITSEEARSLKEFKLIKRKVYEVACTAYNPLVEQTDKTPRITSIGTRVKENYTIAVSQDFLKKKILNYGDTIYIYELQKYYTVEDIMNKRYSFRIDIFMEDKKEAEKFGLRIVHFSIIGE